MYCVRCGKNIDEGSKYCTSCGYPVNGKVKEEHEIKDNAQVISILGMIFSFIIPVIGLILNIISICKCSKYKSKTGNDSKYKSLSFAGLIISIIMTIIHMIIIFVVVVFTLVGSGSSKLNGTWNCSYSNYSYYVVTAKFNEDKTFTWKKYNDSINKNYLDGTYFINSREYNNGITTYEFKLRIDHQIVNGDDKGKENAYIKAKIYDDNYATIYNEKTNKIYHCKKVN